MTTVRQSRISSIVAVGPHPDDVEILCMGALLKLREAGARVTIVCLTNGDKGAGHDPSASHAEVAATRFREASQVAAEIGGEFVNLGAEDEYLYDTPEMRNKLAAVLRHAQADVVLAPSPTCYQTDHTITSEITFQATHLAALPQLRINEPALPRAPATYYYDTVPGLDFEPSFFLDITEVFERKTALARLHVSQMASMKAQSGWDLVEAIETLGRMRGMQASVKYAEAFQICRRYPRVRAWRDFPS
jgi:LmbE family N-acetylglucosaminyl deacetylase